MGWTTIQRYTLERLIKERTDRTVQHFNDATWEVLDHSKRGNRLWKLVRYVKDGTETVYIALDLLSYDKKHGAGYKDMTEGCGPCYYDCPLKFLKAAPLADGDHAKGWREKVVQWHKASAADRKKMNEMKIEVGQRWKLAEGLTGYGKVPLHTVTIERTTPYILGIANDGTGYRLKKKHLVHPLMNKEVSTLAELFEDGGANFGDKSTTQES
jgi:hypothetical protein